MRTVPGFQWWLFIAGLTIVHLIGMISIDIMEIDAAQYASLSQEMMQTGEYLEVKHRAADYLDKPPLLFWVTSLSFKILGASNFTFRLPSFLFLILGLFATYKLGSTLYDRRTGQLAVLVLYSTQAYFLFSHDVRTDTILANVVIFAVWQLWLFIRDKKLENMVLGAIGVALAMLEKGPIGLMVPVLALGAQVLYTRRLKIILRWEWLVGLVVIALILSPMVYGLYQQFGMHGVEFYFWTQSFGRITGQSEWQDNSTVFYFVHTFLWAFLPWMLVAYFGIGRGLYHLFKNKFKGSSPTEVITLAGFLLTFIAMSLSRYKLPHYVFVVFPLAAIITSNTLWYIIDNLRLRNWFIGIQSFINVVLMLAACLLAFISFSPTPWYILVITIGFFVVALYSMILARTGYDKVVISALLTMIGVNFLLSAHVYPTLLKYQAGSMAGRYLYEEQLDAEVYCYKVIAHGLDFYSGKVAPLLNDDELVSAGDAIIYTTDDGLSQMETLGVNFDIIKSLDYYHVTELTIEFLNPETRKKTLGKRYLVKVK